MPIWLSSNTGISRRFSGGKSLSEPVYIALPGYDTFCPKNMVLGCSAKNKVAFFISSW